MTVTLQAGQTLASIAAANGLTEAQLLELNPQIKDVKNVPVGQIINVDPDMTGLQVEQNNEDDTPISYEQRGRQITAEAKAEIDKQINEFKAQAQAFGKEIDAEIQSNLETIRSNLEAAYEQGEATYTKAK